MNGSLNYLLNLSPESKARVTFEFKEEIEEACLLISLQTGLLQKYEDRGVALKNDNPRDVAFQLMHRSATSMMASLELALGGYMWEPASLLRNAMEASASAWDIVHNKERFAQWTNHDFKSTKSISNVAKVIEPFGKLYGLFSNMYVHAGPINAVPSMYLLDGEPQLQMFGYLPKGAERLRASEIYIILLAAFVCLQITEIIFWKFATDLETIELIEGRDVVKVKVSSRHRKFVDASLRHFEKVVSSRGMLEVGA